MIVAEVWRGSIPNMDRILTLTAKGHFVTECWTEDDFDDLGWHDVHVHGLRIVEGEHGAGQLCLDIDYILDWICPENDCSYFRFKVAPALLSFRDIMSLRYSLDYATPGAAMGPFSISGIERETIAYGNDYTSFHWIIPINWPDGRIEFDSPGFTLELTGPAVDKTNRHPNSGRPDPGRLQRRTTTC